MSVVVLASVGSGSKEFDVPAAPYNAEVVGVPRRELDAPPNADPIAVIEFKDPPNPVALDPLNAVLVLDVSVPPETNPMELDPVEFDDPLNADLGFGVSVPPDTNPMALADPPIAGLAFSVPPATKPIAFADPPSMGFEFGVIVPPETNPMEFVDPPNEGFEFGISVPPETNPIAFVDDPPSMGLFGASVPPDTKPMELVAPPNEGLEFGVKVPPDTKPIADPPNADLELAPNDPPGTKEGALDVEDPLDTLSEVDDPTGMDEGLDAFTNDIIGSLDDSGVGGGPSSDDMGPCCAASPHPKPGVGSEDMGETQSSSSLARDGL